MSRPPEGEPGRPPRAEKIAADSPSRGSRDRRADGGPAPAPAPQRALAASDTAGLPHVSPAEDDTLTLPQGALLAMRRSGGLLFSVRAIVVYPDGRLVTSASGEGRPSRVGVTGALPGAQLATLRRILEEIDFASLHAAPPAHPRPDAYAYELVAPPGRRAPALEVLDGAIPPVLAPLIRLCNGLLAQID